MESCHQVCFAKRTAAEVQQYRRQELVQVPEGTVDPILSFNEVNFHPEVNKYVLSPQAPTQANKQRGGFFLENIDLANQGTPTSLVFCVEIGQSLCRGRIQDTQAVNPQSNNPPSPVAGREPMAGAEMSWQTFSPASKGGRALHTLKLEF